MEKQEKEKIIDPVFEKDITDIIGVKFPNIEIKSNDAVIYCTKIGWKFGLFLNFTRNIDLEKMYEDIGGMIKDLHFDKLKIFVDTEYERITDDAIIITEGKTDWKHLKKAKNKLSNDLSISFLETTDNLGDTNILRMCKYYAKIKHDKKIIFIFDQDNPKILKELNGKTQNGYNYQEIGKILNTSYANVHDLEKAAKNSDYYKEKYQKWKNN